MGVFARGDLVVVAFPFSDLSDSKLRPALVLARAAGDDYILCQLTSQAYHADAIQIDPEADVPNGKLRSMSYARPLKLFTGNSQLIRGTIGKLSAKKLYEVTHVIAEALTGS